MDKHKILTELRKKLMENIDQNTKDTGKRYFKEKIKSYGVKVSFVSKISKDYFKLIEHNSNNEIFSICGDLWDSGFLEEQFIACNWSYYLEPRYERQDFEIFEKWLNSFVDNWASCDTLCNHSVGSFLELFPEFIENVKNWTHSSNRWMKRGAAVSLIIPARKGKFLNEIISIADDLLEDKDDLVQKGYGWMLKAASESHQQEIFQFVMKNKSKMPRTSLRYAIEKMPDKLRKEAMSK